MNERPRLSRRSLLSAGLSLAGMVVAGRPAAAALTPTPAQTTGPFYPTRIPLDSDNDLVQVQGLAARAMGEVAHVTGRILDTDGRPVGGARVEIWQCDANGRYHHPRDTGRRQRDGNFQGYGRMTTGDDGAYRFRTIKPVPYPGRTPHIHFAVSGAGLAPLTTQMYIAGHPLNDSDFVLTHMRDPAARARLTVPFVPAPQIEAGALSANFDIVLDRT